MDNIKVNLITALVLVLIFNLSSCTKEGGYDIPRLDLFPVWDFDGYHYIDRSGKEVISTKFLDASVHREGVALVTQGENMWEFINESGEVISPASYLSCTIFNEGMAWVLKDSDEGFYAIDYEGKMIFTLPKAYTVRVFSNELAAFRALDDQNKMRWGFVDGKGHVQIEPQFTEVSWFNQGLCAVMRDDGKWGYINQNGEMVINYQFSSVRDFFNGYAVVSLKEKEGIINKEGKYVVNPQFEHIYPDGRMFSVRHDSKWGWINQEGQFVIHPQFEETLPFYGNKIAPFKADELWGYVNDEGTAVITAQFDEAYPFNDGLALVRSSDLYGFISSEGKFDINPQYSEVSDDLISYFIYGGSKFEESTNWFRDVEAVAESFIVALQNMDYQSAKDLATERSAEILDMFASMAALGDETNNESKEVTIINSHIEGERASVIYRLEGDDEEQTLELKKEDGKWKVVFDKESLGIEQN